MIFKINDTHHINTNEPIDISIPIHDKENPVLAWYCEPIKITPVKTDRFIGDVNQGGAVNFRNIFMNPHAHGTHTECVGHISKEWYSINQCLKKFHFQSILITVEPEEFLNEEFDTNDRLVTKESIKVAIEKLKENITDSEVLIVRTLPNDNQKLKTNYSATNPIYFSKEAISFINDCGFNHLMVDLPSIDREEDKGQLIGHHTFWNYPDKPKIEKTITELIYAPSSVKDGLYICNIQITSLENDASPSKIVLYQIQKS